MHIHKMNDNQKGTFRQLSNMTRAQRNRYYASVISFETGRLQTRLENIKTGKQNRYEYATAEDIQREIDMIPTSTLRWLRDAEEYYDTKLASIVAKLDKFGLIDDDIMLIRQETEIAEGTSFEFQLRAWNKVEKRHTGTVHARATWVSCWDKASHWRFITTYREDESVLAERRAAKKVEEKVEETTTEESQVKKNWEGLSRTEQVRMLMEIGATAPKIAETLGANVSYVRTIMRKLRQS